MTDATNGRGGEEPVLEMLRDMYHLTCTADHSWTDEDLNRRDEVMVFLQANPHPALIVARPAQQVEAGVPEGMMTLRDELIDKADELDAMDARGQAWGLEEWADLMRRAAEALNPAERP